MLRKTRSEIMKDFREQTEQGKILVGVGAGTGITAKCSEKADVDMLIIYNSGRFRMAGTGSSAHCKKDTCFSRSMRDRSF